MFASPARLTAFSGLFVVTAAFIPVKARAQDRYQEPRNADVPVGGATTVRIEAAAGTLRVEGHSGITQVRVRGTARASQRGRLQEIKLIAERRGNEVFIKADLPDDDENRWRFSNGPQVALDLVVEVPISMALDVDDSSGESAFLNTGRLALEDGSGAVEIRGAHGDVEIDDSSGEVDIDGVEGSVRISDGSGEIRVANVTGNVTVTDDGSGSIDVSGIGGTMRVDSDGSGDIDVDRIAGDFVVDSDGSGGISYQTVKGRVSIPEKKRRG